MYKSNGLGTLFKCGNIALAKSYFHKASVSVNLAFSFARSEALVQNTNLKRICYATSVSSPTCVCLGECSFEKHTDQLRFIC